MATLKQADKKTFYFTITVPEEIGDSVKRKKHYIDGVRSWLGGIQPTDVQWISTTKLSLVVSTCWSESEIIEKLQKIFDDQEKDTLNTPLDKMY